MDRKGFFGEMKKGLFETLFEISKPFVQDEIKKIDTAVESLSGIHWVEVPEISVPLPSQLSMDKTILKQPVMIYIYENKIYCLSKKCVKCGSFLTYLPYNHHVKCLSCDEESHLHTGEGTLQLQFFQTKVENRQLYVGIPLENMK